MAPSALAANAPQGAMEVLINGTLYDVTGFRHPGGSIVKFMAGSGDASEAFNEFHHRSKKAVKMLATLPNRPLPSMTPVQAEACQVQSKRWKSMSSDFLEFRKSLINEGWFRPAPLHVVYRVSEIVLMHAVGIYLLLASSIPLIGLVVLGIAQGRCGWLMHEGGHGSLTGNIVVDRRLQEVLYGVGCGMSGAWWRNQHNKHHATPQKLRHDVDLDTLPFIAFHSTIAKAGAKSNPIIRAWIKFQAYTFAPISCTIVALGWQLFLHPRHMLRTKRVVEAVSVAVRIAIIAALGSAAKASLGTVLLAYLFYDVVGGTYIFTNFALSHTHLGVSQANEHVHWLEYAATYTINITPHLFTNWWMGYLNFQIEHHLFPSMPQYRFVQLSPRVKELFRRNGLKYDVRDYFAAVNDTFTNLNAVGATA